MHLWVHAGINLADCFLATDVKEQDLFVCAHTYGKRTISCHLDAVNVSTMSTQVSDVLACFTVPDLDVFIDLAA